MSVQLGINNQCYKLAQGHVRENVSTSYKPKKAIRNLSIRLRRCLHLLAGRATQIQFA